MGEEEKKEGDLPSWIAAIHDREREIITTLTVIIFFWGGGCRFFGK